MQPVISFVASARSLVLTAMMLALVSQVGAATIIRFGFDAPGGGNNISESTGWDGTTLAAGGNIDSNVVLTTALHITGNFVAGNDTDAFHVDNWHSTDLANQVSQDNSVSFTIAPQNGYTMNLGDGTSVFSTHLHDHAQSGDPWQMFDRVSLYIAGNYVGDTTYVHGPGTSDASPQTLSWNIAANPALTSLSGATTVSLYFWDSTASGATPGSFEPGTGDNAHGPQWSLSEGAFIQLNGIMVPPVPEPSRALLGFLGLGLAFLRRRRR